MTPQENKDDENEFLLKHKEHLTRVYKICIQKISTESVPELREIISDAVSALPKTGLLRDQAERDYRREKYKSLKECPADIKGTGREMWVQSDTADAGYARDRTQSFYQGLVLFISAAKAELSSLQIGNSNSGFETAFGLGQPTE